jgi:hypothetical protein
MDFLSDPPMRKRETAATSPDAELISLARQIEALEIARDVMFDGIKDEKRRQALLDEIDAVGEELRKEIVVFSPSTVEGFVAVGSAIYAHRYGRDGGEISSEFDEVLTHILVCGLEYSRKLYPSHQENEICRAAVAA